MFTHASPLLAFGFMNLPLLGWLAAAAAPILIHLWMRRKYREAPWAAMEYLLAALRRQSRRLHFEQWLLLAVRTLLVVLVVLAVAEPYLERPLLSLAPGGRTHRVLVLDGSFSMAYQPADQTRFDRAKELAREIVESAPAGDAFTLLLMTAPPQVVVGTPALAADKVAAEIEALRQPHTTADLPAAVPHIREVIATAQRESPRLTHHEVIFLTDLQRAAWAPRLPKAAEGELQRQMVNLAETATLVLIDVGQPSADNLAVADVRLLTAPAIAGRTCRFQVAVKSFAAQPAGRQAVELLVDGRRVAQRHVDVPAGGEASVVFEHRFDRPGDRAVEVRAEGDALATDNRRYLAVPVRRSVSVLCIEGRPSGKPFGGAADYLAVALAPADEPGLAAPIEVEVAPESAILERDLSRYDLLAMCNVAQFTAGETDVLSGYLRGGGSLLVFLGDQVMPERYNRELGPGARKQNRMLPAELGPAVDTPEGRL
ncbi:MAG: vWA domain-containing protein, partial [Thermoguttaceae bacterium]